MGEEGLFFNWRKKERELLNHLQVVIINLILSICFSIMAYIQYWEMDSLIKGLLVIFIVLFSELISIFKRKFARVWIFVLLIAISYLIALNTSIYLFWFFLILILIILFYLLNRTRFFKV